MKVKKGWMAVQVGLEDEEKIERFEIPISYLYHPLFIELLDKAREVYEYHVDGPLKLPCSVDEFLRVRSEIERDQAANSAYHRHRHPHNHRHQYQLINHHALSPRLS